ncbi:MAG: YibE/F family protein [Treponema sp.]|nr:YibE/F family protein [Treponema sp.]
MIKIKITYLITIAVSVLLLIIGHNIASRNMISYQNHSLEVVRAKVRTVVERVQPNFDFIDNFDDFETFAPIMQGEKIIFEAQITKGNRKGEIVTAEQSFSSMLKGRLKEIEKGDNIHLIKIETGWSFDGYTRINKLIILGALFVVCLIIFGGKKGFNTILSLGFTCTAIFSVFIPAILSGKNIYVMSVIVCIYTIAMVNLIVIGYNKKAFASMAGCAGGVIIAGITAVVMDKVLYLTGIVDEHSRYLINLGGDFQLNLNAVVFAGIIIGAMGAIMDVSISISSSLWEVKEKAKTISFKELLQSGITIGRDIMGSMADTLILAYIGSSLSVVLILTVFSSSLLGLFNSEMFAVEVLQAMAGSLGILFAMPLTALFSSVIYLKEKQ